jgi:predicted  nucleic acid-binding Zn-ribbon protein
VPISFGELVDKITILELKAELIDDAQKLGIINKELTLLRKEFNRVNHDFPNHSGKINSLMDDLFKINRKLWDVENKLRSMESHREFESEFIEAARKVYKLNDKRAKAKIKINKLFGSTISEVKSYTKY